MRNVYLALLLLATCAGLRADPTAGVLMDNHKKPVAGIKVYSFLFACVNGQPGKPTTEASTVTDPQGKYSLGELPPISKEQYRCLVAYKAGKYIGWTTQVTVPEEYERYFGKQLPLAVAPAVDRTGRVVDVNGHPLVNVPVKYVGLNAKQSYPSYLPGEILQVLGVPTTLTTAYNGAFIIKDAPANADVFTTPKKKGFAAKRSGKERATLRIVLVPAGKVEGTVKDAAGKPVKGAQVSASLGCDSPDSATTNANGRFVLSDLAPGKWYLTVNSSDRMFDAVDNVTVTSGKTTHVRPISSLPMATVEGEVVYTDTGNPAPGVTVRIFPERRHFWTDSGDHPTTDTNGIFKANTATGQNSLTVGNLPTGYVADPEYTSITVSKTGLSGVKIKLKKADVAKGKVVDNAGQPVVGAIVSIYQGGGESSPTNVNGEFELTLPSRERSYQYQGESIAILAQMRSRKLGTVKCIAVADLVKAPVTITLEPLASAKVHVDIPSGKPAVGARISYNTTVGTDTESSTFPSDSAGIRTDAHGNATVGGMIYGAKYQMVVAMRGYVDSEKRQSIAPGTDAIKVVTVKLQEAKRVQRGRVIDENGKPVADAEVIAEGQQMTTLTSTKTNALGHFVLRGLPDNPVNLRVNISERHGEITVSKYVGTVTIQLVPYPHDGF